MSNIFPKEKSTESLTAHHWEEQFLCTIWNIKWFKFPHGCLIHSNIFPTSTHTPKSELKLRSYGPDNLEKKNKLLSRKLVATRKLGRDQKLGRDLKKIVATSLLFCDKKCCRNLKKAENCYFDLISSPFHPSTIYILVL